MNGEDLLVTAGVDSNDSYVSERFSGCKTAWDEGSVDEDYVLKVQQVLVSDVP